MHDLEQVINVEFGKAVERVTGIQEDNIENITELQEFLQVRTEPKCDEEHEFAESTAIRALLADLDLKMSETSEQLKNSDELFLPHYTRVVDEQNRHSVLLLELFARTYTLYSEMILQEFEGHY